MPFDGVIPASQELAWRTIGKALAPTEELSIWEWADKNIVLPRGTTPKFGPYRTDLVPMSRELMEVLSPSHPCKKVVAMISSQLFKTQVGINFICYHIAHDAQTQLVVYPTLDLGEDWSKDKFTPIATASRAVNSALATAKSRDGSNTILKKSYTGGSLKIAGANTPTSLASRGGAILYFDEIDRAPQSAGIEGDPLTIAERALIAYQDQCKEYISSTPTIKSLSKIYKLFQLSDQRRYHVPCPHCDDLQELKWDNLSGIGVSRTPRILSAKRMAASLLRPTKSPCCQTSAWVAAQSG
jgi:phage terminase large subunit GpA-like protein